MNIKYRIAGFNISVEMEKEEYFSKRLKEYEADFADCDMSFIIKKSDDEITVSFEKFVKTDENEYFHSSLDCDYVINYDNKIEKIIAFTKFSRDYRDIEITLYNLKIDYPNLKGEKFSFNVMGNAFDYAVQMNKAFVFHSSAICAGSSGIAFSAKSGTGKSTHTGLWLEKYNDVSIINDDTPVIKIEADGNVYLCGTPWAGTSGINKNICVPLKGIVFLLRGKDNMVEDVQISEAFRLLFEGIKTPVTDIMLNKLLNTVNNVFLNVNVYKMYCNMNSDAAAVARKKIIG